jgi:DNA mismatch repair protein MutS
MMQQYMELKAQHKDSLLLFRLGDFYELFNDDAKTAAPILEIALTRRGKSSDGDVPMCGIPYHSADVYIQKLIKAGYKVAICEQLESPEAAKARGYKAIVRRDIVRIITPGTITEDTMLNARQSNYLVSVVANGEEVGIAYADLSTLEFHVVKSDVSSALTDVMNLTPAEVIMPDSLITHPVLSGIRTELKQRTVTFVDSFFDAKKAERKLQTNFDICTLDSLGKFSPALLSAAGALVEYFCITQKKEKILLNYPKVFQKHHYMVIDKTTATNLELFTSKNDGKSLLDTIDSTITNAGSRLLKKFLTSPILNIKTINDRLDFVELFIKHPALRSSVRDTLKAVADVERSLARLVVSRGGPRELYSIQSALKGARSIAEQLGGQGYTRFNDKLLSNEGLLGKLNSILLEKEGHYVQDDYIKRGYDIDLDECYSLRENSQYIISNLRKEYINKTGVQTLKLEFNNVLGYFIEVTKAQASKITGEEFIHRQSTMNQTRFVTQKLKEAEAKILGVNQRIKDIEARVFEEVSEQIIKAHKALTDAAQVLAFVDVVACFAVNAVKHKCVRPIIDESQDLVIVGGRHPVVEQSLQNNEFIANDAALVDGQKMWLITGPNMAGKSTFLRQNALIAILAHIGSFVPAQEARIGLVDRVFSRIGAGDDLARGHSTFLVEMIETATILNQATDKSLVILDEIGRGTSTYDGVAIAWSCLEYIHDVINSRTLFSTHYHELAEVAETLRNLKCYTVSVKEWQNKVIFLHKVVEGVASHSYGINVAEIAGLPKQVIARSREVLARLHKEQMTIS